MQLEIQPAYEYGEEIKELFAEYTRMLIENEPGLAEYLKIQNYDSELEHLTEKYGLPWGRLYIARAEGKPAGCIGLRRLNEEACEMKRLYVRPEYRGMSIAGRLARQVIDDGKEIGYKRMLLDTLPFLKDAIHLYGKLGFYEIHRYNDSPVSDSVFMELVL